MAATINDCTMDAVKYSTGSIYFDSAMREYHYTAAMDDRTALPDHGDRGKLEAKKEEGELCLCTKHLWN